MEEERKHCILQYLDSSTDFQTQKKHHVIKCLKALKKFQISLSVEWSKYETTANDWLESQEMKLQVTLTTLQGIHHISLIINRFKALKYCHDRCIVHRDVKPSNILINFCGLTRERELTLHWLTLELLLEFFMEKI
jgi:serine/threonine protein kinase